jgi:hypothetical protein
MEVIASDAESVTIKLRKKEEYAKLLSILGAFSLALSDGCIDTERLMISPETAERIVDAFYNLPD